MTNIQQISSEYMDSFQVNRTNVGRSRIKLLGIRDLSIQFKLATLSIIFCSFKSVTGTDSTFLPLGLFQYCSR